MHCIDPEPQAAGGTPLRPNAPGAPLAASFAAHMPAVHWGDAEYDAFAHAHGRRHRHAHEYHARKQVGGWRGVLGWGGRAGRSHPAAPVYPPKRHALPQVFHDNLRLINEHNARPDATHTRALPPCPHAFGLRSWRWGWA